MARSRQKFTSLPFLAALMISVSPLCAHAATSAAEPGVYFYPAQKWNVAQNNKTCSISSQFNNGFIMNFTGGEKWVQGLDINFRQSIFEPGKNYDVTLSVPGVTTQTFKASVRSADTLGVSLRKDKDFYQALRKAAVMDLTLEDNSFRFYLTGFSQSAGQFENCMAEASAPEDAGNFLVNESIAMEAQTKSGSTPGDLEISHDNPQPVVEEIPYKEQLKVGDYVVAEKDSEGGILDTDVADVVPATTAAEGTGHKRLSEQLAEQIAQNPELIEVEPSQDAADTQRRSLEMPPNMEELSALPPSEDDLTPVPAPVKQAETVLSEDMSVAEVQEDRTPEVVTFEEPPVAAAPVQKVEPVKAPAPKPAAVVDPAPAPVQEARDVPPAPVETPQAETIHKSTPPMKVQREYSSIEADFTSIEPSSQGDGAVQELRKQIIELEKTVETLKSENVALNDELQTSLRASEEERLSISSENWNLERATMKFNEAERQITRLGQQLQREKAKCSAEKKDLEAMLFDPQVTNEAQLARLASLEDQLAQAKKDMEAQRIRYEQQISVLQGGTQ